MKLLLKHLFTGTLGILMSLAFTGCGGGSDSHQAVSIGPSISFTSARTVLMAGNSTTLQWSVTDADQVTSPDFTADGISGEATVTPTATTTYHLYAQGASGQASASVTVVVVETGKIAFISNRSGADQLFIMNTDGTGGHALISVGTDVRDPAISPDGSQVAYVSMQNGNADIYVANTDGSGTPQQISTNPADETQPAWSGDGNTLAWTRAASDTDPYDLIITKSLTDGTEQEQVGDARNPCWDPTGERLAFTSRTDGSESIYVIDLSDGGDPIKVASLGSESLTIDRLSWSATGQIAFGCYDSTQASPSGNISVVPATGGTPTPLITNAADDGGANWSPSGNHLVFYSNRDGNYELYLADANGATQTRLTSNNADDGLPSWSRQHKSR